MEKVKLSRNRKILLFCIGVFALCCLFWGKPSVSESSAQKPVVAVVSAAAPETKPFETLTVYKDKPSMNHYAASGYMPVGRCVKVNDAWVEKCQWGKSCIRVDFDGPCATRNMGWAGVYWLDPANNWGDQKGGFDLRGATQLSFWARGEKGGEMVTFKMGGSGMNRKYPDSDSASIGPLTLSKEWKEYTIPLKGKDLSRIIGGFAFVASDKNNPGPTVFYIDEIYYK